MQKDYKILMVIVCWNQLLDVASIVMLKVLKRDGGEWGRSAQWGTSAHGPF